MFSLKKAKTIKNHIILKPEISCITAIDDVCILVIFNVDFVNYHCLLYRLKLVCCSCSRHISQIGILIFSVIFIGDTFGS